MKHIKLTKGAVAQVCDCHYDEVAKNKWYFDGRYAARHQWLKDEKRYKGIRMHQVVLPPKKGVDIDHIDRDKLNNQCSNLRYLTRSDNIRNKAIFPKNTSGYRGVSYDKSRDKWLAYATVFPRKFLNLGRFDTKEEAAQAAAPYYEDN